MGWCLPNIPADLIFLAWSDLAGLQSLVKEPIALAMCIRKLAEILEKVIKAELVRRGWFLIKTHDLVKLNDELRNRDAELADRIQPLTETLAEKYFTDRYPGLDLDDEDGRAPRAQTAAVAALVVEVKRRTGSPALQPDLSMRNSVPMDDVVALVKRAPAPTSSVHRASQRGYNGGYTSGCRRCKRYTAP